MLAPFLVELFNRSLLQGTVPKVFNSAYITHQLLDYLYTGDS